MADVSGQSKGGSAVHVWAGGESLLVTNKHVVEGQSYFVATFPSGNKYTCRILASDATGADLALLSMSQGVEPVLQIADSDPATGAPTYKVGYPASGGKQSKVVNLGQVVSSDPQWLYVTNAVRSGDSGGAITTADARLVGIVSEYYRSDGSTAKCRGVPCCAIRALLQRWRAKQGGQAPVPPGNVKSPPINPPTPPVAPPERGLPGSDGAKGPRGEQGPEGKPADMSRIQALENRLALMSAARDADGQRIAALEAALAQQPKQPIVPPLTRVRVVPAGQ